MKKSGSKPDKKKSMSIGAFNVIEPGEPQQIGEVTVFPLIGPDAPTTAYVVLEEAIAGKSVEVKEFGEDGGDGGWRTE